MRFTEELARKHAPLMRLPSPTGDPEWYWESRLLAAINEAIERCAQEAEQAYELVPPTDRRVRGRDTCRAALSPSQIAARIRALKS